MRPTLRFGWKGVSSSRLPYFTAAAPVGELRHQEARQILTGLVRITELEYFYDSMSDFHEARTWCILTAAFRGEWRKEERGMYAG